MTRHTDKQKILRQQERAEAYEKAMRRAGLDPDKIFEQHNASDVDDDEASSAGSVSRHVGDSVGGTPVENSTTDAGLMSIHRSAIMFVCPPERRQFFKDWILRQEPRVDVEKAMTKASGIRCRFEAEKRRSGEHQHMDEDHADLMSVGDNEKETTEADIKPTGSGRSAPLGAANQGSVDGK